MAPPARSLALVAIAALALAVASACGSRTGIDELLLPTVPDAGSARPPVRDAGVDAGAPGQRDAGRDVDATHLPDAFSLPDTMSVPDVVDVSDAVGHGCFYTGMPSGTVTVLATASSDSFVDYGRDCSGLVYLTTAGEIDQCPRTGCAGAPNVVAPAGSYVAAVGLVVPSVGLSTSVSVLSGPTEVDGGIGPIELYAQPRAGGAGALVMDIPSSYPDGDLGLGCVPGRPNASAAFTFFPIRCPEGGLPIDAVAAVGIVSWNGPSMPLYLDTSRPYGNGGALYNATYYVAPLTPGMDVDSPASFIETLGVAELGPAPKVYVTQMAPISNIFANESFVVWAGQTDVTDGGFKPTYTEYVCAAGPTCDAVVALPGTSLVPSVIALGGDTIFLQDETGTVSTCSASTALATGSCTPNVLATALPDATQARVFGDFESLDIAYPTQIVRIAR